MDSETRRTIEELKAQYAVVQNDIERIEHELSVAEGRKKMILDKITELSDPKYEEDMLALVYEQRKAKK